MLLELFSIIPAIWSAGSSDPNPSFLSILALPVLLIGIVLSVVAVLFPDHAVRMYTSAAKLFYTATMGPDWETLLERQGRSKELDLLRRGAVEPRAFRSQMLSMRIGCIFIGALVTILFVGTLVSVLRLLR